MSNRLDAAARGLKEHASPKGTPCLVLTAQDRRVGVLMPRAFAVVGVFDSPDELMAAIPRVRAHNLGHVEAYTPYPIHGLDEALALRRSPLGGMVLVMGIVGAVTAFAFQHWISAVDYPIVTGGKPPTSWEAFIPILFEVTVLFATFTAGLGMLLLLNKLPFFGHPLLESSAIKGVTRDRFALAIEASNGDLDTVAAYAALNAAGATELELLETPEPGPFLTYRFVSRTLMAILAACVVSGIGMYAAIKLFHVLPPMGHMQEQPRINPQTGSAFFADGHGMRTPVPGTVARGHMPLGITTPTEAVSLGNPLPAHPASFGEGRRVYQTRCVVCHDELGTGVSKLGAAYGGKPANLQSDQFRAYTDGQIFWVIRKGKNAMPGHAPELTEAQSWAAVHYVRALQRAQRARDEDLK